MNIKLYKKTPMNIGLFLFERTMDHRIITKKYYEQQNGKRIIIMMPFVDLFQIP